MRPISPPAFAGSRASYGQLPHASALTRARGRRLLLLALLLPLTACGLFQNREIQKLRKSPDYKVGYQDGCNSAYGPDANKRHDDTIVRDDKQYESNRAYHVGWDRGIRACRSSSYSGGNMPGVIPSGPIPDQNPGNGGRPRGL